MSIGVAVDDRSPLPMTPVRLHSREWGGTTGDPVVCLHGLTQHGGIFEPLGRRLAAGGHRVVAIDLRGHGESERLPPWDLGTHVDDVLETIDALGIERAAWVGHSFGGRVLAELAARAPERVDRLALLEPGLGVPADHALRQSELDRLDWSFATVDGATNALLASDTIASAPEEVVAAYVADDVKRGPDGRFRFSFCPSVAVVAWSEMTRPEPPIAELPTLLVISMAPLFDPRDEVRRHRAALGSLLTVATVPNGHNVLWESPLETGAAIESFLAAE
jgi:lipase